MHSPFAREWTLARDTTVTVPNSTHNVVSLASAYSLHGKHPGACFDYIASTQASLRAAESMDMFYQMIMKNYSRVPMGAYPHVTINSENTYYSMPLKNLHFCKDHHTLEECMATEYSTCAYRYMYRVYHMYVSMYVILCTLP
jgi:hypothetical protein